MQNDAEAAASDMTKIKSNAVQIGLPAAESYAIKDAAEKIGPLFGKDLNRRDAIVGFRGSYTDYSTGQNSTAPPEAPIQEENTTFQEVVAVSIVIEDFPL